MELSLLTLNMMHGRNSRNPVFPAYINSKRIEKNLDKIAALINKIDPDVAALQEIDECSILTSSVNHFAYLKFKLNFPYTYFAPTLKIKIFKRQLFVSGNAILSKFPLTNCKGINFNFSFPTERKGFCAADVNLPDGKLITVASIHLVYVDWTRPTSRVHQLKKVAYLLKQQTNSFILAGDFNCDTKGAEKSLSNFISDLNLNTFEPYDENLNTHPSWQPSKRIDWILLSKNIEFTSYKLISDKVSDHLAIFATIKTT